MSIHPKGRNRDAIFFNRQEPAFFALETESESLLNVVTGYRWNFWKLYPKLSGLVRSKRGEVEKRVGRERWSRSRSKVMTCS